MTSTTKSASLKGPTADLPAQPIRPPQIGNPLMASTAEFPAPSATLEAFGLKFSAGGAHISRTIMSAELALTLAAVPKGSLADEYRSAVLERNILGKTTVSTRQKSFRHLRELYGMDESVPIFALLRTLDAIDPDSQPLLAFLIAWSKDPLLRATSNLVLTTGIGDPLGPSELADGIQSEFPSQYSERSRATIGRNAASSWTQSGHLLGRTKKTRQRINPTPAAVTMALFLGSISGYHGTAVFSNPWCRILDLDADRAKGFGQDAHRAGLLNLRAVGEVVEISFPLFAELQGNAS